MVSVVVVDQFVALEENTPVPEDELRSIVCVAESCSDVLLAFCVCTVSVPEAVLVLIVCGEEVNTICVIRALSAYVKGGETDSKSADKRPAVRIRTVIGR